MKFDAIQSGIDQDWWVCVSWPKVLYRHGGTSLLRKMPDEETAREVAAHTQEVFDREAAEPLADRLQAGSD
jgi:hypothetical protein